MRGTSYVRQALGRVAGPILLRRSGVRGRISKQERDQARVEAHKRRTLIAALKAGMATDKSASTDCLPSRHSAASASATAASAWTSVRFSSTPGSFSLISTMRTSVSFWDCASTGLRASSSSCECEEQASADIVQQQANRKKPRQPAAANTSLMFVVERCGRARRSGPQNRVPLSALSVVYTCKLENTSSFNDERFARRRIFRDGRTIAQAAPRSQHAEALNHSHLGIPCASARVSRWGREVVARTSLNKGKYS